MNDISDVSTEAEEENQDKSPVFSTEELKVLFARRDSYRAKERTKEERRKIVQKCCKGIKPYNAHLTENEWKARKKEVTYWLNNNGRQLKEKELYSLVNSWSLRRVVGFMEKTKVKQKATALSGHEAGHTEFFSQYQNAVSAVLEELSADQLEHYDSLAAKWNKLGCPPEAQQDNWKKNGRRFLQSITKTAWEQYGMRMVLLANVKDKTGIRVMAVHDENHRYGKPGVHTMEKEFPMGYNKVVEAWNEYTQYTAVFDDQDKNFSGKIVSARKQRLELELDNNEMPILPPISEVSENNKEIIRSFLTEHYRLASGKRKALVPWTELNRAPQSFISAHLFPEGVKMTDPSKLSKNDAAAFIELWHKVPFVFKAYQDKEGYHPALYTRQTKLKKTRFLPEGSRSGKRSHGASESEGLPRHPKKKSKAHSGPEESDESDYPESDSDSGGKKTPTNAVLKPKSILKPSRKAAPRAVDVILSSDDDMSPTTTPTPKPRYSRNTERAKGPSGQNDEENLRKGHKVQKGNIASEEEEGQHTTDESTKVAGKKTSQDVISQSGAQPQKSKSSRDKRNKNLTKTREAEASNLEVDIPTAEETRTLSRRAAGRGVPRIAQHLSPAAGTTPRKPRKAPETTDNPKIDSSAGLPTTRTAGPDITDHTNELDTQSEALGSDSDAPKAALTPVKSGRKGNRSTAADVAPCDPPIPRTTRSMTGATPIKRVEVVLNSRPRPRPTLAKGKSLQEPADLGDTMRRTSQRTLARAKNATKGK